ncbi:MAG: F0F1 ATP synthase subunit A [Planctomycetaceae bacterium]|nr:F0F1 ATP synthase subunit A [Planctomycetaceae bacterium]
MLIGNGQIWLASASPLEEVTSKVLFTIRAGSLEIPFTNHMFVIGLTGVILLTVLPFFVRKPQLIPRGFYNVIETICIFLREDVARPFLKDRTDRYIGVLWTLFFFILGMNLLGLVPLGQAFFIVFKVPHIGGAPTANLYVTGALALFSFLLFHIAGMVEKGFWHYFATLSPKVPWPMMPFMFVMELLSSFTRTFSLAIRLFANIFAGHMLLSVILGFIVIFKNYLVIGPSLLTATAMSLLEIFVAFLQAYIFVFLTTIFLSFAISEEHG